MPLLVGKHNSAFFRHLLFGLPDDTVLQLFKQCFVFGNQIQRILFLVNNLPENLRLTVIVRPLCHVVQHIFRHHFANDNIKLRTGRFSFRIYTTVCAGGCQCTFGIKKDGRVLFTGENWTGGLRVLHLNDVAHIEATMVNRGMVLHRDGTVRWLGENDGLRKRIAQYRDVAQISAAPDYFAALFKNGTVRLLAYFWKSTGIEGAVNGWTDIKAIAAGRYHIVGVKKDGTVTAAMLHPDFEMDKGQCNVEGWEI